MIHTIIS